jgi:four helix bundle protein
MRPEDFKERTMQYALRILKVVKSLRRTVEAELIGRQLLRCGTSAAANYRAACRARSRKEFAAKMGLVVEEADESLFWLELLVRADMLKPSRLKALLAEGNEIVAMAVSSRRTARSGQLRSQN